MFVGRSLTERLALDAQYDITLFNRGKSNAGLFPGIKQLHGNRESEDIEKITRENWDAVIDFSGYYPLTFVELLKQLRGKVGRYIFISTISVYNWSKLSQPISENDEILACNEEQKTSKLPDAYGEKKAEMERILLSEHGLDKIIFRPSFIYGKYDWTERFYYWLYRVCVTDKILIPPVALNAPISLTNAGDLVEALIQSLNIKHHGEVYNAISQSAVTLKEMILLAAKLMGKEIDFVEVNESDFKKLEISYASFPLCVPPKGFEISDTLWKTDFQFPRKDLGSTLKEMIDYNKSLGLNKPKVGLSFESELEIIKQLSKQS